MRIAALAVALSLVTVVALGPLGTAQEQRTRVQVEGNESGVTATVSTQGDLANETETVTVPPGGSPSPPGVPGASDVVEFCNEIVGGLPGGLQCL